MLQQAADQLAEDRLILRQFAKGRLIDCDDPAGLFGANHGLVEIRREPAGIGKPVIDFDHRGGCGGIGAGQDQAPFQQPVQAGAVRRDHGTLFALVERQLAGGVAKPRQGFLAQPRQVIARQQQ